MVQNSARRDTNNNSKLPLFVHIHWIDRWSSAKPHRAILIYRWTCYAQCACSSTIAIGECYMTSYQQYWFIFNLNHSLHMYMWKYEKKKNQRNQAVGCDSQHCDRKIKCRFVAKLSKWHLAACVFCFYCWNSLLWLHLNINTSL